MKSSLGTGPNKRTKSQAAWNLKPQTLYRAPGMAWVFLTWETSRRWVVQGLLNHVSVEGLELNIPESLRVTLGL